MIAPTLVFLGGGLGSVARWAANEYFGSPLSTLIVNLVGSFAIGLLLAKFSQQYFILLFVVGVLGGFTTFSGFSIDMLRLWNSQSWWWQYFLFSVVGSIFLCWLGNYIGSRI